MKFGWRSVVFRAVLGCVAVWTCTSIAPRFGYVESFLLTASAFVVILRWRSLAAAASGSSSACAISKSSDRE